MIDFKKSGQIRKAAEAVTTAREAEYKIAQQALAPGTRVQWLHNGVMQDGIVQQIGNRPGRGPVAWVFNTRTKTRRKLCISYFTDKAGGAVLV